MRRILPLLLLASAAAAQSFPRIDAHAHSGPPPEAFLRLLARLNLRLLNVTLVDPHVPGFDTTEPQTTMAAAISARSQGRIAWASTFDPKEFESPDFAAKTIRHLQSTFDRGAVAVKIYKSVGMDLKSKAGAYVMPDDPAFSPVLEMIAASGRTLLAHLGEPQSSWRALDPADPHYGYYKSNPDWHMFRHPERPSWESIIAARDRMLEAHPKLRVVGCHLGSMEHDVDEIARRFDRYPNFAVDTAARLPNLARQPRDKVRAFLIRYQDRVLWGTDLMEIAWQDPDAALKRFEQTWASDWRYFESLGLPETVMRKIFHDNAVRWIPGLREDLAATVKSPRITVAYDEHMQRRLQWNGAEGNVVAFDPGAQEGIAISGAEWSAFRPDPTRTAGRRVTDPEFGPALEATVAGSFEDIERTTRILLPDQFPDAVLFESAYRNLGARPLHIDRVWSQRVLLDRRLAEPQQRSCDFASFQGGAYKWGTEYAVIRLQPDFRQSNFQGVDDVRGPEGVGGGMPFIDVWGPTMGVALMHLEKTPQWLSLPVEVRPDRRVEAAVVESPQAKLGQQEWLLPNATYRTVLTAVVFHRLDYFDALKIYGQLLRRRGIAIPDSSPAYAHEPYWKSWGWVERFTVDNILNTLPELKSMGIRVANVDMGWYDHMGDWQLNRATGKFPGGEPEMVALLARLHKEGFRSSFWWYPLGVEKNSRLARERKDLLVQDENGTYPLDINDLHQLCPAYEPALQHLRDVLTRAVSVWGFDGAYSDYQGMSAVPACFNPAHHHRSPLDSFQAMPRLYEMIQTTLHRLKPETLHEVCICSLPHSPYYMPFYDLANASDPVSTWQVRSRVKAEKAIRGGTFAVGDCYQVPLQEWTGYSVPESFESAMGTGAQLTTFYRQLDPRQRALWGRWFGEYRELDLTHAEYVNLYDLAFDKPEVHVLRKGDDLYYGIFADVWPRDKYKIELRGLDRDRSYEVYDYANRRSLGVVEGASPVLNMAFKDSLLLRVRRK